MAFLEWLQSTWVGVLVAESLWGYPLFEAIHSLGMAMLIGSLGLINLRVLGYKSELPLLQMQQLLPLVFRKKGKIIDPPVRIGDDTLQQGFIVPGHSADRRIVEQVGAVLPDQSEALLFRPRLGAGKLRGARNDNHVQVKLRGAIGQDLQKLHGKPWYLD